MDMFDRKLHDPYHTELPYYIKFSTRETLNYELLYSLGLLAPMHSCCIRLVSVVFDAVETVIDMSVLILSRHVQIQHNYVHAILHCESQQPVYGSSYDKCTQWKPIIRNSETIGRHLFSLFWGFG